MALRTSSQRTFRAPNGIRTAAVLLTFAWTGPALAQVAPDAPALLAAYAKAITTHEGLVVVASRTSRGEPPPGHHRLPPPESARLSLLPPHGYKLEVMRGPKTIETIVSDGKTQWLWNSKFATQAKAPRKLRYMSPDIEWAEKAYWPLMLFTSPALPENLTDLAAAAEPGGKLTKLSGRTHAGPTAVALQVWFDVQDQLPRRLVADDGQVQVTMEFAMTKEQPAREVFAARPPAGLPQRKQEPEYPKVKQGAPAPAFTLAGLDGKKNSPAQLKGKVVLLDFWAPWCPTCMLISPFLNRMQKSMGPAGVQIVAISTMAAQDELRAYVEKTPQDVMVLHDPADEEQSVGYARYKISGLPSYVLLDKKGIVQRTWKYYWPGASEARLLAYIEEQLDR